MARLRFMTPLLGDSSPPVGSSVSATQSRQSRQARDGGAVLEGEVARPQTTTHVDFLLVSLDHCVSRGWPRGWRFKSESGNAETGGGYVRDAGWGDAGAGRPR